jgi:hypothetical protein
MNNEPPRLITPDCQPEFPGANRHLSDVIAQIQAIAPDLHAALESTRTSAMYAAPEMMRHWWGVTADILEATAREHPARDEIRAAFFGSPAPSAQPATGTPRTDANAWNMATGRADPCGGYVPSSFARTLERELAEAKRDLDDAEERLVPLIELVERHTLESEESFETEDVLEGHYKERDDLRTRLTAAERRLALADELAGALEIIASYDKDGKHGDGICPYGCDTPHIARSALTRYAASATTTATKD